jgi:His-Xaa-Ser system radical SAM maturase HxsB
MSILPFNFERISDEQTFISNTSGFHTVLNHGELNNLIDFGTVASTPLKQELTNKLFISSQNEFETSIAALASSLGKQLVNSIEFRPIYMIVPTLRCDHTCKYCQVSRASIHASGYDLDELLIPKIISTIASSSNAPYKIELQGGEPLLRFDLIAKIYSEAELQLKDTFQLIIATSLSPLSDEMLKWAKDKNVFFSVSLDGGELVHNANRIHPTKMSYSYAIQGIKRIKSELGSERVSTVTTVTDALIRDPKSLLDAHMDLGLFDLFIRPVSPYGFANTNTQRKYTIKDYMKFYEKLWTLIREFRDKGIHFTEHSIGIHAKRLFKPSYASYADLKSPSGVVFNCILFNYDGKVFGSDESRMLQKTLPNLDFSLGEVGNINLKNSPFYTNITAQSFNILHPGCETCAFQPYCGSDPCQNISLQGEPVGDKSISEFCNYHKSMFRFLVQKYFLGTSEDKLLLEEWANG